VGRYEDENNYLVAYLDKDLDLAKVIVFSDEVDGGSQTIANTNELGLDDLEGTWFGLELEMDGQTTRLWMDTGDGRRLIAAGLDMEGVDGEPVTGRGMAGMFTRRQEIWFDDFEVRGE